jgi:hypothetical protein
MYCEENVWLLWQDPRFAGARVALISNSERTVALGAQRAGADGVVVWDYHVVLASSAEVYDLDSLLPFPCPLERYLEATFGNQQALPSRLRARLRLVDAADYARELFSDRAHMRGPDGTWKAAPPPWPPPDGPGRGWRLLDLIDMTKPAPGRVVTPDPLSIGPA